MEILIITMCLNLRKSVMKKRKNKDNNSNNNDTNKQ